MKTHYQVIGVADHAEVKEIKRAYRKLVKEYHPDVAKNKGPAAAKAFEEITAAWNVLSDADKRRDYDAALANKKDPPKRRVFAFREIRKWLFSLNFVKALLAGRKVSKPQPVADPIAAAISIDELLKRIVYSPNPHVQVHSVRAILARKKHYAQSDLLRLLASNISEEARIAIIEGLDRNSRLKAVLRDLVDIERSFKVKQAMRKAIA